MSSRGLCFQRNCGGGGWGDAAGLGVAGRAVATGRLVGVGEAAGVSVGTGVGVSWGVAVNVGRGVKVGRGVLVGVVVAVLSSAVKVPVSQASSVNATAAMQRMMTRFCFKFTTPHRTSRKLYSGRKFLASLMAQVSGHKSQVSEFVNLFLWDRPDARKTSL